MTEKKTVTVRFPMQAGITDLRNMHPGLAAEWWTLEDWERWEAGTAEREEHDRQYIQRLTEEGRFGEVYYVDLTTVHNPAFDDLPQRVAGQDPPFATYSFIILNLNDDTHNTVQT